MSFELYCQNKGCLLWPLLAVRDFGSNPSGNQKYIVIKWWGLLSLWSYQSNMPRGVYFCWNLNLLLPCFNLTFYSGLYQDSTHCWSGDWCRDGSNQVKQWALQSISKAFHFQAIGCSSSSSMGSLPWFYHYWAAAWWCLCIAGPHRRGDLQLRSARSDIKRNGYNWQWSSSQR